jgi:protein-S-isoprenylcysteine O-methyltransferase Ste14
MAIARDGVPWTIMAINSDLVRRLPPPGWFAAAAGAQVLLTRAARPTSRSAVAAALMVVGGGITALAAVAALRRHGTTITPEHPEQATALVTDGPFAFTRNPIYLALAGALVAHAVLRRSPAALIPAAAFVAVIDRAQIPAEERALREHFGQRYEQYSDAVPRWIGLPRR